MSWSKLNNRNNNHQAKQRCFLSKKLDLVISEIFIFVAVGINFDIKVGMISIAGTANHAEELATVWIFFHLEEELGINDFLDVLLLTVEELLF